MKKAKLTFYVDIYPSQDLEQYGLYAVTKPGAKTQGYKRYAFDVYIPNANEVDEELLVENMREVDKE